MVFYALITLDIDNVDSKTREEFYLKLKEKGWNKINNLTTTWSKTIITFSTSKSNHQESIEKELKLVFSKFKIKKLDYAIMVSDCNCKIGTLKNN